MSKFIIGEPVTVKGYGNKVFFVTQTCDKYCIVESTSSPTLMKESKYLLKSDKPYTDCMGRVAFLGLMINKIENACREVCISKESVIVQFLQAIEDYEFEVWQQSIFTDLVVSHIHKDRVVNELCLVRCISELKFMLQLNTSILHSNVSETDLESLFIECHVIGLNFDYVYLLINEFMSESGRSNDEVRIILSKWLNELSKNDYLCDIREKLKQTASEFDTYRLNSNVGHNKELPTLHINIDEKLDNASVKMPAGLFNLFKSTRGCAGVDVKLIINNEYYETIHVDWPCKVFHCFCNPYRLLICFGGTAETSMIVLRKFSKDHYEPPKFQINVGSESFIGDNPLEMAVSIPKELEDEYLKAKHSSQHSADVVFKLADGKEVDVRINLDNACKTLTLDDMRIMFVFDESGGHGGYILIRRFDQRDKYELSDYAACIIDIFEDFLDDRCIQINNTEKEGDSEEANIYGSDYDELMEKVTVTLEELLRSKK